IALWALRAELFVLRSGETAFHSSQLRLYLAGSYGCTGNFRHRSHDADQSRDAIYPVNLECHSAHQSTVCCPERSGSNGNQSAMDGWYGLQTADPARRNLAN